MSSASSLSRDEASTILHSAILSLLALDSLAASARTSVLGWGCVGAHYALLYHHDLLQAMSSPYTAHSSRGGWRSRCSPPPPSVLPPACAVHPAAPSPLRAAPAARCLLAVTCTASPVRSAKPAAAKSSAWAATAWAAKSSAWVETGLARAATGFAWLAADRRRPNPHSRPLRETGFKHAPLHQTAEYRIRKGKERCFECRRTHNLQTAEALAARAARLQAAVRAAAAAER